MTDRTNIRHVVFFSAKDKADVPRIVDGLSLLKEIPYPEIFEVRRNTRDDAFSTEVDVVVYAEFENQGPCLPIRRTPCIRTPSKLCGPYANYGSRLIFNLG